jgi:hypothetical protein
MYMRRDFVDVQRMTLLSTGLTQEKAISNMDGRPALQIGQLKINGSIAAKSCPQQGK